MILNISGYIIIPLEMICCKIFFEIFCKSNKFKVLYRILFWGLICMLVYISAAIFRNMFLIKQITIIVIVAVAARLYWDIAYKKSFMLAFLFESLVLIADYITIIIDTSILEKEVTQNQRTGIFLILLTKMILFVLIIIIRNSLRQSRLEFLSDVTWLKFMFFPFFTICIIVSLVYKPELITNEKQKQIFWIFALGLIVINIMLFYMLQDVADKEHELYERKIFEREARHKLSLYESMAEATRQQRELSHEYQNQLICIQSLLYKKQYENLEKYLKQITGRVLKNLDYIDTNNAIVNAILNEKYFLAVEQGIVMVYKINDLEKVSIEDQDIAVLLSNLLNNAIEACHKCTSEKIIKVKFILEDDNIVISVKNTYNGHVITSGESYITTKNNKRNHGIGINNIIRVIEKYDGFYSITHDGEFFSFSCVIPK